MTLYGTLKALTAFAGMMLLVWGCEREDGG